MSKGQFAVGVAIIAAGIVILLGKSGFFGLFWPMFLLLPGVLFHLLFFGKILPSGVLIPGGILSVYALLFMFCNIFGWSLMAFLWPVFILGVAVGLYEFYLFDKYHPRGALIASVILGVVSAVLFGFSLLAFMSVYVVAFLLIALGVWVLYRKPRLW